MRFGALKLTIANVGRFRDLTFCLVKPIGIVQLDQLGLVQLDQFSWSRILTSLYLHPLFQMDFG